jgi:hypothetical protein
VFYNIEAQWVQLGGPDAGSITCLYVNNCELFAGTDHGLYLSSDGCGTWTKADSIKADLKIFGLIKKNSTIFAGTITGGIYKSDGDYNWQKTNAFDSTLCVAVNDSFILAGNTRGIQRCRVDDSVWTWVNKTFPSYGIASIATHDSMAFASGYLSGAFRSTDYGKTWSAIDTTGFQAVLVTSFAIFGDTVLASMLTNGIYRSVDNGVSWTKLTGFVSMGYRNLTAIGDSIVTISTTSGVYYSLNFGSTWTLANTGLENKSIYSFFSSGNDLYAGTESNGVWYRTVSDLCQPVANRDILRTISQKNCNFKIKSSGSANIKLTIEFTLPEPAHVKIKLYDLHSREILSPVDNYFRAGTQCISLNNREITPGFYIAKMFAGTKVYVSIMTNVR